MSDLRTKQSFLIEATLEEWQTILSRLHAAHDSTPVGQASVVGSLKLVQPDGKVEIEIALAVRRTQAILVPKVALNG